MKRSIVFAVSMIFAYVILACATSARAAKLPDLTVSAASPAYALLATCAPGGNAIVFHVVVSNIGDAASAAINSPQAVSIQDSVVPAWSGGAKLPAIASKGSAVVDVFVPALTPPSKMWGLRKFNVTVDGPKLIAEKSYANNTTAISVTVPAGFCPPPSPVSPKPTVTPAPTSKPSVGFNPSIAHAAPNALVPAVLPPPVNLAQALTKDVCQAHGGSAGSFACYIGLPAGKVALVWDYPSSSQIDGYYVYRANSVSSGPTHVQMVTIVKPIAQVTHADWKFAVLDKQSAGSCFAVTAYHGNAESARSVQYCIASNGVAKTVSLDPNRVGTMVADAFVWADKSPTDNEYANRNSLNIRDLLYVMVGHSHTPSLYRDQAHTQVSAYTNSIYRGYALFNTSQLYGHQIAQAQLSLPGGSTTNGVLCIVHYGAADHMWNPGDRLIVASNMGNGPYQGPDLNLDVTALVQSWANGAPNNGIAMDDDQPLASGNMVMISDSCTSNFPTVKLNVTYY